MSTQYIDDTTKDEDFFVPWRPQAYNQLRAYIYTERTLACLAGVFLILLVLSLTVQLQSPQENIAITRVQELTVNDGSRTATITCSKPCLEEKSPKTPATEKNTTHDEPRKKKYKLVYKGMTWFQALEYCFRDGKALATIESDQEHIDAMRAIQAINKREMVYVWIGLTDLAEEGTFTWAATGKQVTWPAWADYPPQPSNSGGIEHCVEMWRHHGNTWVWNDRDCSYLNPFLCEYY